ncbi:hypothetical protein [Hippea maritima]|uniref:Uncharacterized protein n=1 Tax=Hippea maritima (strain ATCC 700847 / DSM 10411 / MH2) TaxID=760142 RepID=F2LWP9_HIPMA|nr:hypothetical protein [Hippea maritima]AEA33027.1 hypothetical protein Hipma_0044 [Hippea maritima DSM 10411]
MDVSSAALNPILHYKLDPGEWGSSAPATAGTSVARVASHESANLQRFESKATKEGCYVVGKDLYLNLQKNGIYLAATSGHSSAITYCPKRAKQQEVNKQLGSLIDGKIRNYENKQVELDTMLKTAKNKADETIYESKLRQIKERKLLLQQKKMRLYTQVTLLFAQNLPIDPSTINVDLLV